MRVVFEPVDPSEHWQRVVDMGAVPRVGDDVKIDGVEYPVTAVIWDVDDDNVVVRLR